MVGKDKFTFNLVHFIFAFSIVTSSNGLFSYFECDRRNKKTVVELPLDSRTGTKYMKLSSMIEGLLARGITLVLILWLDPAIWFVVSTLSSAENHIRKTQFSI